MSFMICTPHQILGVIKSWGDEMGKACGMYGGRRKCMEFLWGTFKERDHLDVSVDGLVKSGGLL
jgi:hypothetical protein